MKTLVIEIKYPISKDKWLEVREQVIALLKSGKLHPSIEEKFDFFFLLSCKKSARKKT